MQDWQWEQRNRAISNALTMQLMREEIISKRNYTQFFDYVITKPKEEEMTFGTAKCHLCNAAMKVRTQRAYTKYGKKTGKIKKDCLINTIQYQCGTTVTKTTDLETNPVYSTTVGNGCIKIDSAGEVKTTETV